jgi:hypothetical protein
MDPFGDNIPAAQPDLYCGEYPHESLHRSVREALVKHIDPSALEEMPIIPNFFLECQDSAFPERDVKTRAQHHGAVGSRAIHSLQNYGNEELEYDNQPYTFSVTYHEGNLMLYAHHVTKPYCEGELPAYHMNQIHAIHMTASRESFIEGITAFRNARDEAQKHRDRFIAAANRKRSIQQEQENIQQEQENIQLQQLRDALQHHDFGSDVVRQMTELVQQIRPQPAAASAAPLLQAGQSFQAMLQQPAAANAAPMQQTAQASQVMFQPPAIASAAPFHPTTQAFHTMPQPPAPISDDPIHSELENRQQLNEGPTAMPLVLPPATCTSQAAVPSQTATRRKRPGPSQDAPSQPSVKQTRTGRKY